MNDLTKNVLVFIVIIVVLLSVVQGLSGVKSGQPQPVEYSQFLAQVKAGEVDVVEFSESNSRISFGNRQPLGYYTINPEANDTAAALHLAHEINPDTDQQQDGK